MLQRKDPDGVFTGHRQASVQPSVRVKGNAGIFMHINDHFASGPLESTVGCGHMMVKLNEVFAQSIQQADQIIDQIMSLRDVLK
jgi:hypothetical protein